MKRIRFAMLAAAASVAATAGAAEVTVRNDSLDSFTSAVIVTGFIAGGGAASWLTSPCDGNVRAVQVFWRSASGVTPPVIQSSIQIFRSGTYPNPGTLAETIGGPVVNDNVLNEWRFLDENNLIPLNVPVTMGETVVVALFFDTAPPAGVGPSVVRDTDGIQPSRNTIFTNFGIGFGWHDAGSLGVTGDWVIRAVVDCPVVVQEADVSVALSADPVNYTPGAALSYSIVVGNDGPAAATGTTVVDVFPAAYTGVTWTCSGSGGATCPATGSGNISHLVNLPAGSEVVFEVDGTVAPGTSAPLNNSVTAVVPGGVTDPVPENNTASLETPRVPEADVAVGLSADPVNYVPGAALGYVLVINNAGPGAAAGTTIVDIFPAAYTGVTWTCSGSGGGTCPAAGSGNISHLVNLPAGGEVVFDVDGVVAPGSTTSLSNSVTAVVAAGVIDPVSGNNSASLETPRAAEADVGVGLSADPLAYLAGQALQYTLVINNAGPDAAPGTSIVATLPAAYTDVDWTCAGSGGASCSASGSGAIAESVDLPSGGEVVFAVDGIVAPGTTGPLLATVGATVDAAVSDPTPLNNTASLETEAGVQTIEIFADGFEE